MKARALLVVTFLAASAAWAQAQPLAEIARAEEARRKAQQQTAKVYTNDELRSDFTKPAPTPDSAAPGVALAADGTAAGAAGGAPTPAPAAAPAAAAEPARDQAYWAGRITEARSKLERSRTFAIALQSRINALLTDFVNRDNPVERAVIEQDRIKALAELERVNQEVGEQTRAISDIEDEARRLGVPAGWLRP